MDALAAYALGQDGLTAAAGRLPVSTSPLPLTDDDTSLSVRLSSAGQPTNAFEKAAAREVRVLDGTRALDSSGFSTLGQDEIDVSSVRRMATQLMRISLAPDLDKVREGARGRVQRIMQDRQRVARQVTSYILNPAAYAVRVSRLYAPYTAPAPQNEPSQTEFEDLMADIFGMAFNTVASASDRIGMFLFTLYVIRSELDLSSFPLDGSVDLLWMGLLLGPDKAGLPWRSAYARLDQDVVDSLPLELPEWGFYWVSTATVPTNAAARLRQHALRLKTVPRFVYQVVADSIDLSRLPVSVLPMVGEDVTLIIQAPPRPVRWFATLLDAQTARDAAERDMLPGRLDIDASAIMDRYVFDLGEVGAPVIKCPPFPFIVFGLSLSATDDTKYNVTRVVQVYPQAYCVRSHSSELMLAGIEEKQRRVRWELPVLQPYDPMSEVTEAHYTLVWHWNQVRLSLGGQLPFGLYSVSQQAEAAVRLWANDAAFDAENPIVRALALNDGRLPAVDPLLRPTMESIARELWYETQARERAGQPARHESDIRYTRGLLALRERQRARFENRGATSYVLYEGQASATKLYPDFLLLQSDIDSPLIAVADTSRATIVASDGPSQTEMLEILRELNAYQRRALPGLRERVAVQVAEDVIDPYGARALDNPETRRELYGHYLKVKGLADRFNRLLSAPNPDLEQVPDFDLAFTNELRVLRE